MAVGEELYLRCMDGFVMDRKYDTTTKGLPIMCGNGGQWEYPVSYNESLVDGCTQTPMCDAPPAESGDHLLTLLPYDPIDHTGKIAGGYSVFYQCSDPDMLLNDDSGRAVFELLCDIKDPAHPKTEDPNTWPKCVKKTRCSETPDPDTNATVFRPLLIQCSLSFIPELRSDERCAGHKDLADAGGVRHLQLH